PCRPSRGRCRGVPGVRLQRAGARPVPAAGAEVQEHVGAAPDAGAGDGVRGSSYAGDPRLPDLQPNEGGLVAFAVDLGTEVNAMPSSDNGRLTQVKAVKGVLHTTTVVRKSKAYTVANRNDRGRTALLEHLRRHGFLLADTDRPA